ncbi:MAG: hypothetical protein FLDDKLPJ_03788 [Phycisphaerae bacterium]|nr:hypothetical protein [Phycisphaerae bacterium]
MPYRDPVVEEVRANGAKLSEEFGGDIHKLAEHLRTLQRQNEARVVHRKAQPRRSSREPRP